MMDCQRANPSHTRARLTVSMLGAYPPLPWFLDTFSHYCSADSPSAPSAPRFPKKQKKPFCTPFSDEISVYLF